MFRTRKARKAYSTATFAPGERNRWGKVPVGDQGGCSKDAKATEDLDAAETKAASF